MLNRRQLLATVGAAGVGGSLAWGLASERGELADRASIIYALARPDSESGPLQPLRKRVPGPWLEQVKLAFKIQNELHATGLSSLLGSFAIPGSFDDPQASLSVDATDEGIGGTIEELAPGLTIDLTVVEEIPPDDESEPTVAESYQVPDLDRRRVPGGYTCAVDGTVGTLAPAMYDQSHGSRFFVTSNHLYGAAGRKRNEHVGEPLSLLHDRETRPIGRVARGYPLADLVRVAPIDGYRPVSEIARASPGTVVGQYTTIGLADLMARGEPLQKVGAFSDRTTGALKGVDGVTCYTGKICKRGQLKWGTEDKMVDGDSGSVSYHESPEHPDEYVLVAGMNNARTWWPGMDFTWGTAAHHLLSEYGLHF